MPHCAAMPVCRTNSLIRRLYVNKLVFIRESQPLLTDCKIDGRRSLAACKKGLLNSKNYVTMGLDVVPGAEEQPAMHGVRVLWHWVEVQGFSGGSRSVDQMTELAAHWFLRVCCAFLILVAAGTRCLNGGHKWHEWRVIQLSCAHACWRFPAQCQV